MLAWASFPGLLGLFAPVTLEPALGPLLSAANPLLSLRTSSLSAQDGCPLSPPLLPWCSLAVPLPSLESCGSSGLGPVVPHPALRLRLWFPRSSAELHIFPPGTPWYSLSLRRLGQAAGRELCQVPRLPCQKEALDPCPVVSSPLGVRPSLELLGRGGRPIGQMQSWGGGENPSSLPPGVWVVGGWHANGFLPLSQVRARLRRPCSP